MAGELFLDPTSVPALPQTIIDQALALDFIELPNDPENDQLYIAPFPYFKTTKFFKDLVSHFGQNILYDPVAIKSPPFSIIDWHHDRKRDVGMNFLLSENPGAVTAFRTRVNFLNYNLIPWPYKLGRPLLFNSSREHCVVNITDRPRYVLSLGWKPPITYRHVAQFFQIYKPASNIYDQ